MNCTECGKPLRWVGDEILEDHEREYMETILDCSECDIDVIIKKYITK